MYLMATRLSVAVPMPTPANPVPLYLAPPYMTSLPLSMQPSMVAETMGRGMWWRATYLADAGEGDLPIDEVLDLPLDGVEHLVEALHVVEVAGGKAGPALRHAVEVGAWGSRRC